MRAVIFSDVPSLTSIELSKATLEAARHRPDFEVCGFVTAVDRPPKPFSRRLRAKGRRLLEAGTGGGWPAVWNSDLRRLAHGQDLPFVVADGGVNSAEFVERLHRELRPDVVLSYFATTIFKPRLLDSVSQAVNYHDGLLPDYAGLAATCHSIYMGEDLSGYTFHRMTPGIDDGPILVQGAVAVTDADTNTTVNRAKVAAAVADVPNVIDLIERGHPGTQQVGDGSYFNRAAYDALTEIDEPGSLTAEEIQLRLRAFGTLEIVVGGEQEFVTGVANADRDSGWSFQTSDGQTLRATRIAGLPTGLIDARRRLRKLKPRQ